MQIASSRTRRHPLPGARDATRANWQRISSDFIAMAGIVRMAVAAMIYPLLVETALCAGNFPWPQPTKAPHKSIILNVCILSFNSRAFLPCSCFGPLLWASVVDRNFVQATDATTAEIRNQIRKPLGGAGSGGIHNNFKTNQNECLEFHDFHGVFWGLCCIIVLSLGWLDTFAK